MDHNDLHPDLEQTVSRLARERPRLAAHEVESLHRRIMARAARKASAEPKGIFMKSRLALISMLAVGMLMSGTGATLAIDGISSTQNAATAQYGAPSSDEGGVLGETGKGNVPAPPAKPGGGGGAAGDVRGDDDRAAVQPTRQIELGTAPTTGQLPFTGYAGITIMLIGLALLSTGLLLRRRIGLQS